MFTLSSNMGSNKMRSWGPPGIHPSVRHPSRKRSFLWSRRQNGFSDNPKWRAVQSLSAVSLCTVLAFVNRLEEIANDASNRGNIRGCVSEFKAQEFAAALDISVDDANKLYTTLEHPDIGWIADSTIVDFHDRNPDIEDPTAADRQRRLRSRNSIRRKLAQLDRIGFISKNERSEIENSIAQLDHEQLVELQVELETKSLNAQVTRDARVSRGNDMPSRGEQIHAPSSVTRDSQNVTRDNVTVTLDENKQYSSMPSVTLTNGTVAGVAGLAKEKVRIGSDEADVDPATWLKEKGVALIMDRMGDSSERAGARLSSWSQQLHDNSILANILQQTQNCTGPSFHMQVADQIRRHTH